MDISILFEHSIDHPCHQQFMKILGLDPKTVVTYDESADMGLYTIEDLGIDYNVRREDLYTQVITLSSLNVYVNASLVEELSFLIPDGIQFGMMKDQAIDVLGAPDKNNSLSNTCVWERKNHKLKVRFDASNRLIVIFYTRA